MKLIIFTLLLISMISCGKNNLGSIVSSESQTFAASDGDIAEELPYSYNIYGDECSTGEQSSKTFSGICSSLKNSELNNTCAEEKREALFISEECPGDFS